MEGGRRGEMMVVVGWVERERKRGYGDGGVAGKKRRRVRV